MKKLQKFAISGDRVHPFTTQEGAVVDSVPAGYYLVKESMFGYFLENKSSELQLPEKIYGNTTTRSDRIWNTFDSKDSAIAAGLFGSKGAGKTLLANVIAQEGIKRGYPVIDVSSSFNTSSEFLEFIDSIGNCVVIFDEFLKRLSKVGGDEERNARAVARERQDDMLTFFQGTHNSKRLVILIDNESYMLSEFFRDRPGRMRYNFIYRGVTGDIVEQLALDAGLPQNKVDMLVTYSKRFSCTFDMINEIVFEWKMHPEDTLEDITEVMNVPTLRPVVSTKVKVVSFLPGESGYILDSELATQDSDGEIRLDLKRKNPAFGQPEMERDKYYEDDFDDRFEMNYEDFMKYRTEATVPDVLRLCDHHLVAIRNGQFSYENDGARVVIQEMSTTKTTQFDFSDWEDVPATIGY